MQRAPNIILVHCHDLGRFLGCYGMPAIPSPHLDAFAAQSIVFDNAFSTAPLCSPARGSLFTGQSPHVNGIMGLAHQGWRYRRNVSTLPELLAQQSYETALIGFQHEHVDPTVLGFDEVHGMGFLPRALPVARTAEQWLANRDQDTPYFLTVGMWEVHRPWPHEDYTHSEPNAVSVPPFLPDNEHTREDLAGMAGAIRQLDESVGLVLSAVDRYCDPDNTLVVFTTDHGAAFPGAKSTLYDTGVGVAFIVRPPASWDVRPGRRQQPVSHLDLLPTFLDLAGGVASTEHEGRSLVSDLRDPSPIDSGRALFFEKTFHDRYDPARAIRADGYKYIRNFTEGPRLPLAKDLAESPTARGLDGSESDPREPAELYDLANDPWEQRNLAADPAMADVVARMRERLDTWMERTHDPLLHGAITPPPRASRQVDALEELV